MNLPNCQHRTNPAFSERSRKYVTRKSSGFRCASIKWDWTSGGPNHYSFADFMNKSPASTFLLVVLLISSLASVLFCGLYIRSAIRLRDVQRSVANVQAYRNLFAQLINDTMEYRKKNQAVDPILEAAGINPTGGNSATTNKPPGK